MEIYSEKMSTEMETLIYEKPSLKKYGTMKELTLGTSGSQGDALGANTAKDPDQVGDFVTDINQEASNDSFASLGNDADDAPLLTNAGQD